jgi:hypothetical protein
LREGLKREKVMCVKRAVCGVREAGKHWRSGLELLAKALPRPGVGLSEIVMRTWALERKALGDLSAGVKK